ncbi:MAG TPA: hypothetical protein VJA21_01730 [Verrucomicrobiae bacterium]
MAAWSRARDVLAGEDAVKAAGERYLPRLDSQSEEEYAAYKARASFFGATARTLEEYLDLVFRRAPVVGFGEEKGSGTRGSSSFQDENGTRGSLSIRGFVEDCDGWGTSFVHYARRVVSEVLSVGRGGSLVLPDFPTGRALSPKAPDSQPSTLNSQPHVSLWRAEDILNWKVERIDGAVTLVEVVLRDADRIRVLRMDGPQCIHELWAPNPQPSLASFPSVNSPSAPDSQLSTLNPQPA